jgi:hypothetical protein
MGERTLLKGLLSVHFTSAMGDVPTELLDFVDVILYSLSNGSTA